MQHYNDFINTITSYYAEHRRDFPWREQISPYRIVVSEIMLQQTQTHRVVHKFEEWLIRFPNFESLAKASTRDVIIAWQGLGYNRRALALHLFAQRIEREFKGIVPEHELILQTFKGIGPNTAGSISAFAYNKPTVFIETNIRSVFIHHFFQTEDKVHDKQIVPFIRDTLDHKNPRDWYYALMDYGVMLKKEIKNPSRKSAHHSVQSAFEGSERQIRSMILKALGDYGVLTFHALIDAIPRESSRIEKNLFALINEGFIKNSNDTYFL